MKQLACLIVVALCGAACAGPAAPAHAPGLFGKTDRTMTVPPPELQDGSARERR